MTAVALVGLGNMGTALGRSLLASGHTVTAWNRTAERARPLVEAGATLAVSVAAAIRSADVVIVCLLDFQATEDAFAEVPAEDIMGRTVVQLTLGRPEESQRFQTWVERRGGECLDGFIKAYPREIGTAAARLHYSGSRAAFDRHHEVLSAMGEPFFMGEDVVLGNILNNAGVALMQTVIGSFFETAAYAVGAGVPLEQLAEALPRTLRIAQVTIERSCEQLGAPELLTEIAQEAAVDVHAAALTAVLDSMHMGDADSSFARTALARLQRAQRSGWGDKEIAVLFDTYRSGDDT